MQLTFYSLIFIAALLILGGLLQSHSEAPNKLAPHTEVRPAPPPDC